MSIHYADGHVTLWHGDCADILRQLPDASVDAVVTDPPSGVSFMSAAWDGDKGGREQWSAWLAGIMREALRVTKPGGHAIVWALPRTAHWTACGIEDAGWEIRDCITHLFATGFPKSLAVDKAIDKAARGGMVRAKLLHFIESRGVDGKWLVSQGVADAKSLHDWTEGGHVPSDRNWDIVKAALDVTPEEEAAYEREVIGVGAAGLGKGSNGPAHEGGYRETYDVTAPATDAARQWQGWGTALKPAAEMWWVARKPLDGTVAANVQRHGTGAINIDATRVTMSDADKAAINAKHAGMDAATYERPAGSSLNLSVNPMPLKPAQAHAQGRWPSNVVLTHASAGGVDLCADGCVDGCPVRELDQQSGTLTSGKLLPHHADNGKAAGALGAFAGRTGRESYGDTGGASRFFHCFRYEAKAPTSERPRVGDVSHPTTKPVDLLRFLVRLVTPPGGTVLDCFAGSGTTGEACIVEGFHAILIEREAAYLPLITARLTKPIELDLFGGGAA